MNFYLINIEHMDYNGFAVVNAAEFRWFLRTFERWGGVTPEDIQVGNAYFGKLTLQDFDIKEIDEATVETLETCFGSDYGVHPINMILDWEEYFD